MSGSQQGRSPQQRGVCCRAGWWPGVSLLVAGSRGPWVILGFLGEDRGQHGAWGNGAPRNSMTHNGCLFLPQNPSRSKSRCHRDWLMPPAHPEGTLNQESVHSSPNPENRGVDVTRALRPARYQRAHCRREVETMVSRVSTERGGLEPRTAAGLKGEGQHPSVRPSEASRQERRQPHTFPTQALRGGDTHRQTRRAFRKSWLPFPGPLA